MSRVTLPFELEAKTIAMMIPGETLYIVPWAMIVDREDRSCWLRGDYTVSDNPGGTVSAEVHRNGQGFDLRLHDAFRFSLQSISANRREEWNLQPVNSLKH